MNWGDLTAEEKAHLRGQGVHSLANFTELAAYQKKLRQEFENFKSCAGSDIGFCMEEPCHECKRIAEKLGLPV